MTPSPRARLATALVIAFSFFAGLSAVGEVSIHTDSKGHHTLLRNGVPYLVKGANWPTPGTIDTFVKAGGNSIRTYTNEIEWMLPLAKKHRLTIMAGLDIGRERQGFDYTNHAALDKQFERLRAKIQRYKNEPEILFWAIGNEPEMHAKNTVGLWKEVNRIARMIHEEDPTRPVVTVVAAFDERKIRELLHHCPDLDALGVNWYGPADQWPENLKKFGWTKPYLLTEFGPLGYWYSEGDHTGIPTPAAWGAPIEQTSTEKASLYAENWQNGVVARPGQSLGAYAFIWGPKQERTQTWFSMNLFTGERTALVDAMQTAWTGKPPKNPAPEILHWQPERPSGEFSPGETVRIALKWKCERPAKISVEIRTETTATQVGGDSEPETKTLPPASWKPTADGIEVKAPDQPGTYRIFFQITTADHTAATANFPIRINESPHKP